MKSLNGIVIHCSMMSLILVTLLTIQELNLDKIGTRGSQNAATLSKLPKKQGSYSSFTFATEREGFEPSVRGHRTRHFQCRLFNHSSTAPPGRHILRQAGSS